MSRYLVILFPKPLETVSELRATFAAVGEFADKQPNGSAYRAIRSPPAIYRIETRVMDQLGSDILGTLVVAAVHQAWRVSLPLDSNTPNSTSLGTVLKARTTWARGTFFASSSAPDVVVPRMSFVLPASIGRQQVRSPA